MFGITLLRVSSHISNALAVVAANSVKINLISAKVNQTALILMMKNVIKPINSTITKVNLELDTLSGASIYIAPTQNSVSVFGTGDTLTDRFGNEIGVR